MVRSTVMIMLTALGLSAAGSALACDGFNEAPVSCDDASPDKFAQWMLKRATAAVSADEDKALGQFTRGEGKYLKSTIACSPSPANQLSSNSAPARCFNPW